MPEGCWSCLDPAQAAAAAAGPGEHQAGGWRSATFAPPGVWDLGLALC